jgi:hypothetical protein
MRARFAGTLASMLAMGLWAGCGGAGGSKGNGGGATLTLNPPSLTMTAGDGPVAFYANLTGSNDVVTWSLAGVGTLAPPSAGGMPAYYTPPASVASTSVATITASAAGLTRTATVTVNPPGVVPTLEVTPPSRTVTAGDQPVTFNATLTGSADTITWTRTPAVGDLSPLVGPLVYYTPPASVASQTVVTITATAGALTRSATVTVNPAGGGTITVSGHALLDDGTAAAGAQVRVSPGGHSAEAAADGSFTVAGVATPYDLTVAAVSQKVAVVFLGLTRSDPTVFVPVGGSTAFDHSGTLSGTIASGCAPQGDCTSQVAFGAAGVFGGWAQAYGPSPAPYTMPIQWDGATPVAGDLHALQIHVDQYGDADAFWYGKKTGVSVADGGVTAVDFAAGETSPATLSSVSGTTAAPPAGYAYAPGSTLWLELPLVRFPLLVAVQGLDVGPFTYPVPAVDGATLGGYALAQGPAGEVSVAYKTQAPVGTTGFDIALQAAPSLQAPADGATGISYGSTFTWTPFAGGAHLATFQAGASDPVFVVVTSGTSAAIPDLRAVSASLGLPAAASYSWRVTGLAPASVDGLAGSSGTALAGDYLAGESQERGFTTP